MQKGKVKNIDTNYGKKKKENQQRRKPYRKDNRRGSIGSQPRWSCGYQYTNFIIGAFKERTDIVKFPLKMDL